MLVTSGKMTEGVSEQELIKTGERLPRTLPALRRYWQENRSMSLVGRVRKRQQQFHFPLRPSVRVPDVDAWLEQYSRGVWPRKKFLVLDGPSGMGKTEYARSLFGTEATPERNAASIDHAHLSDVDPFVHNIILGDEASVQMVIAQRRLFQCPACWVGLGGSPTARDV